MTNGNSKPLPKENITIEAKWGMGVVDIEGRSSLKDADAVYMAIANIGAEPNTPQVTDNARHVEYYGVIDEDKFYEKYAEEFSKFK